MIQTHGGDVDWDCDIMVEDGNDFYEILMMTISILCKVGSCIVRGRLDVRRIHIQGGPTPR